MIPALTLFWNGLPKWLQDAIKWTGIILAIILFGKAYVEAQKGAAVRREREKAKAKTIEVVREIEKESVSDADEAIEARESAPRVSNPAELPPHISDRIFRD